MATPQPPKPSTPPQAPPKSTSSPEAGKAPPEPGLPIGAKPSDPHDPQSAKFEPHAAPPRWDEPKEAKTRQEWTPEPALDPLAQKPPEHYYADGMSAADEQRARAAWVEAHGLKEYDEQTDQRPDDEKPKFDKDALAIGGAFVSAGAQKQVQGVAPPAKRS
jgi:hypothetical protein